MYYIDTHTHIYREEYPVNFEEVVQRAIEAQVPQMILACVNRNTPAFIQEATKLFPNNMYGVIGLHPEDVKENYEEELAFLKPHLDDANIIGVGEIGLDYYWDRTYEQQQREAFYQQLCWARERQLPLSMHIRNAYADAIEILKKFKPGELTGVMHCFSGGIQEAEWAVKQGFFLGVGGTLTFKNSKVQEIVTSIGLEHLVLETDAPYLAPVPHRGKPNESAYIPHIATKLADLFQISVETVMAQTTSNAQTIFKLLPNFD